MVTAAVSHHRVWPGGSADGVIARGKAKPERRPIRRLLWWRYVDVVIHLAAVGVVTATWLYTDDVALTLHVGAWIVGVSYLGFMAFEMRRAPAWVSPLSFYFLWYSIGSGLAAFTIAHRVAGHERILLGTLEVRPSDLGAGYILFLIGSVAFHFGVQIARPLGWHSTALAAISGKSSRRYPGLLVILWLLGIIARLFGSPNTPAGAILGVLAWASNAALCAYCLSTSPRNPRLSWGLVAAGCLIELGCNLPSYSKAYLMYSFVPVIWTCVYFRAYRPWLIPIAAGLAAFYLLIVAPVVGSARNDGVLGEDETHATRLLRHYSEHNLAESNLSAEIEKFFERQFDPIPAGFIYGEVERYGLLYGESMDYLAYAFIPRLLWPDKPSVSRGAWFTVYLGGALSEDDARTSTGLSSAGELYWNFGLPGVIAGMTLVGLLVGLLWRIAGLIPFSDPLRMLLYFSTVILVVDNAQAGVTVVGIVYRILVMGSLIWLWDRRLTVVQRRTKRASYSASRTDRRQLTTAIAAVER